MPVIAGDKVTFWKAAAREKDLVYVAVTLDHLVADDIEDSTFLSNHQGQWYGAGEADWSTVAICFVTIPSERLVAISEDGEVHTYVSGTSTQEAITPPPRVLRALSTIGGRAYACGMLREVYVRTGEAQWQAISAPEPVPDVPAGFEAIAGLGEENIYAVGWRGEIWQRKDGGWIQRDSPANAILTGVCCADDGYVYICGQNGTLVKGRDDQWAIIDYDLPAEDYWDIHAFGGLVYVASLSGLVQIKNDIPEAVDFGDDAPSTCHRLTSAEGVLWSVGAEDLFSFDGATWQRIV